MVEGFLLGVIVTASLTAAGFFWRFYRQTRDKLFFAFALAFAIEGINRMAFLAIDKPSEGSPVIYMVKATASSAPITPAATICLRLQLMRQKRPRPGAQFRRSSPSHFFRVGMSRFLATMAPFSTEAACSLFPSDTADATSASLLEAAGLSSL